MGTYLAEGLGTDQSNKQMPLVGRLYVAVKGGKSQSRVIAYSPMNSLLDLLVFHIEGRKAFRSILKKHDVAFDVIPAIAGIQCGTAVVISKTH